MSSKIQISFRNGFVPTTLSHFPQLTRSSTHSRRQSKSVNISFTMFNFKALALLLDNKNWNSEIQLNLKCSLKTLTSRPKIDFPRKKIYNFQKIRFRSSATLASIAFNGCKSSNDDNGNGGNTLTCGTTQCPNFDDYCCAGVNPGACYKKSEMPNERGLQCNTLMGPGGMGNSTFTNFGDNLGKIQNYGKINWLKKNLTNKLISE